MDEVLTIQNEGREKRRNAEQIRRVRTEGEGLVKARIAAEALDLPVPEPVDLIAVRVGLGRTLRDKKRVDHLDLTAAGAQPVVQRAEIFRFKKPRGTGRGIGFPAPVHDLSLPGEQELSVDDCDLEEACPALLKTPPSVQKAVLCKVVRPVADLLRRAAEVQRKLPAKDLVHRRSSQACGYSPQSRR